MVHLTLASVNLSLPRAKNLFCICPPWLYFQFCSHCSVSSFSPSAVFWHSYVPFTPTLASFSTSLVLISSPDFIFFIGVSSHSSSLLNRITLFSFVSYLPFSPALCLCFIVSLYSINLIAIIYFSLHHYQLPWHCYLSLSSHPLSLAASFPWWMTQAVTWLCIHRMLG